MSRQCFRYEQIAVVVGSLGNAAVLSEFCWLFASKGLSASSWVIATLTAGGAMCSLFGSLLASALRGRRQASVVGGCMFLAGILTASVALLPRAPSSSGLYTGIILAAITVYMMSFTARTAIWQVNYPSSLRGGIVSRNILVLIALMAVLAPLMGRLLDWWPGAYRLLFAMAGLSWALSAWCYSRIRVRGEAARLRRVNGGVRQFNPLLVINVLRRDRWFRRYMGWQMILGSASLAVLPIIVQIVATRFEASYIAGAFVLVAAPMIVSFVAIPRLGDLFDKISVFRFRALGGLGWWAGRMLLFLGVSQLALPLVALGRALEGLGSSFGRIAWSLGHLKFAGPEDTHLYMGAHMMLTGIRGLTMPFLGVWLYHNRHVGIHIIWITGLLHLVAAVGYWLSDPDTTRPRSRPTSR